MAAALVVELLHIDSFMGTVLTGCLIASYPALMAVYQFSYYSFFFMLDASHAVFCDGREGGGSLPQVGFLSGAIFLAATSFINQGYIFCTVTLCLLMLICQVLKSTTDLKDTGLFTARLLGLGVLGLLLYLGLTYPVCQVMGIPLGNYAGADNFGGFSATTSLSLSKLLWARLGGYIPAVFLYICGSGQIMSQAV